MSNDTTTKKQGLRPLEVGAGAGAAVITAFASSYLGTAGTLTGAAVASVVGTVSTSVLRSSADRSAERLRQTTARLRETRTGTMPQPTDVRPVESDADRVDPEGAQLIGAPDPGRTARRWPGRKQWVMLGAGAVAAFAVALVLITGIESAAGKPLAGLVGKETGGGTTIGRATGTDSGSSGTTPSSPTPTPTATTTPDLSPTSTTGQNPSAAPTTEPAPTGSAPPPTVAPSATTNPLTSESPRGTPSP
ncbi:MAG TPA: hypothetical protein VLM05_16535 [Mycobacteriales bacterium]|nr:hypothetical protein [Mycobacteriales bacterium]